MSCCNSYEMHACGCACGKGKYCCKTARRAERIAVKALNTEVAQLKAKLPLAASLINDVVKLVPNNLLQVPTDQVEYAAVLAKCEAVRLQFAAIYGPSARVLYMEPDGTVIVDTSKGALNTFANYKAKVINENHNSRVSIISAQLFTSGVGAEIRFSSTVQVNQAACAKIQTGTQFNNQGTIRVSYDA